MKTTIQSSIKFKWLFELNYEYMCNITAEKAMETRKEIKGKPVRMMWRLHKQACNIYIKDIPIYYDKKKLQETFEQFGHIYSCKVCIFAKQCLIL